MPTTPSLAHRLRIAVEFAASPAVVDGPNGLRRLLQVANGSFETADVNGTVAAGSGDWVLERRDGSMELDIRFTLTSTDGCPVYMRSQGLFIAPPEVTSRLRNKASVSNSEYYFRTSILFETADERLRHLNRFLHVGIGQRTATGMTTDVYAVL